MKTFPDFSATFSYNVRERLWYAAVLGIGSSRDKTPTQALSRLLEEAALDEPLKVQRSPGG